MLLWQLADLSNFAQRRFSRSPCALVLLACLLETRTCPAQDRLKNMPEYERFSQVSRELHSAVKSGALSVNWKEGGKHLEYEKNGRRYRYDIASRLEIQLPRAQAEPPSDQAGQKAQRKRRATQRGATPERGRQHTSTVSPNGKQKAFYRDYNVWLCDEGGSNEVAVTTHGGEKERVKYGTASWVYGEELYQKTAMWWSPNSERLAFYRFDETGVPNYYLTLKNVELQNSLYVEPYNKAGAPNPVVDLLVYDLKSKCTVKLDVRGEKAFGNDVVGHYVYGIRWSPDGTELLFHRTDRRQKIMEYCAGDPGSGKCRVLVREEWEGSWVENLPETRFLKDGQRFIWTSERTGWKNYYLYSLRDGLLKQLTAHDFEVAEIVRVDEPLPGEFKTAAAHDGCMYYLARSGDTPLKMQLHRVNLDGSQDQRLTAPEFHHSVDIAPDGKHFVDIAETHDHPPESRLCDASGKVVAGLHASDMNTFIRLGLRRVELFTFKAADRQTDLYGMLHFPSNFRPGKRYPLLVEVYAGPATSGARQTFTLPSALTEFGFLVASLDSRSANGRGKRNLDAIYQNLGVAEVDDQAAGVQFLRNRSYVDGQRVGIYGTSYGGTASLLCLLRHGDVFQAACSSSAVTDFRHYDTIYTERYLGLPQGAPWAYDAVSSVRYAPNLRGRLMLFFGTADDNVHPANTLQLVRAFQMAGRSFELQIGPDVGHASVNRERMMEFFIDSLRSR